MKAFKMTIICAMAIFMIAAFCGCRMEDGKVNNSPTKAPAATADNKTDAPRSTDDIGNNNDPNNNDRNNNDHNNLGEDIGDGIRDIGDDISNASGAAKQVNS